MRQYRSGIAPPDFPECNQAPMTTFLQQIMTALVAEQRYAVTLIRLRYPAFFALLLYGFYVMAAVFVSAAVMFALISRSPQDTPSHRGDGSSVPPPCWVFSWESG